MFGTTMTFIIIGFAGWYAYCIIHDLFFDKSGEVVEGVRIEEKEVDIQDTLKDFSKFNAADEIKSQAKNDIGNSNTPSQDYQIEMSGGIEVDELDRMVKECTDDSPDSAFRQLCDCFDEVPAAA